MPVSPTTRPRSSARAAATAALLLLATAPAAATTPAETPAAAGLRAAGLPAATDTARADSALAWARRAATARRAVAEAAAEPSRPLRAVKAARALDAAEALLDADTSAAAVALVADARELAAAAPLTPETAALSDALEAEAARRAGPAHLFYPAAAEALVAAQAAVARRHFSGVARRGRTQLRAIERVLRRRNLPTDLRAVAVIESGLDPLAVSHAGAAGLWQFMPETAADFGLDSLGVRDPARQTEAAAVFLGRLHRMFRGDWHLALAAYNAGPGRVQRLVRAHQDRTGQYPTFWDLHDALPRETQAYVPRFIATAELLGPAPEPPPRRAARRRR